MRLKKKIGESCGGLRHGIHKFVFGLKISHMKFQRYRGEDERRGKTANMKLFTYLIDVSLC
jgi:hypothetical protein